MSAGFARTEQMERSDRCVRVQGPSEPPERSEWGKQADNLLLICRIRLHGIHELRGTDAERQAKTQE